MRIRNCLIGAVLTALTATPALAVETGDPCTAPDFMGVVLASIAPGQRKPNLAGSILLKRDTKVILCYAATTKTTGVLWGMRVNPATDSPETFARRFEGLTVER